MTNPEVLEWLHSPLTERGDVLDWLRGRVGSSGRSTGDPGAEHARGAPPRPTRVWFRRDQAFAEAVGYRRKDVRCLTVKEEDDLVDAMTKLADDGLWGRFVDRHVEQGAGIHGTLTFAGHRSRTGARGRAADPSGSPDSAIENALNRFLPWHRLFLLEFEDELRAIHKNLAIPYWCWSEQRTMPAIVSRMPKKIVRAGGDIAVGPRLAGTGGAPSLPTTGAVDTVLTNTTFRAFTKALETIHNDVHDWVGGTMGNPSISPADPIFWLVHCEVDRIWTRWTNSKIGEQARLRKENRPVVVGGSRELPGIDMARRMNEVPSLIWTTRAFNLGYGYDRLEDAVKSTCTRP